MADSQSLSRANGEGDGTDHRTTEGDSGSTKFGKAIDVNGEGSHKLEAGEEEYESLPIVTHDITLDLNDEIDDKEFDIPPVDQLPTLESILNEPEASSTFSEDIEPSASYLISGASPILLREDQGNDTSSVSSFGSRTGRKHFRRHHVSHIHGSVLRKAQLRGLSSQIRSASEKVGAGKPTALTVQNKFLAVGTAYGLILVFDQAQVMKYCLGKNEPNLDEKGAVSALSINSDETRLLVGFARGQLSLYSLNHGDHLLTTDDFHVSQTALLHVKFTTEPRLALVSDSGGSVFEIRLRRNKKDIASDCIFSGSRGEVLNLEPLAIPSQLKDKISLLYTDSCLIAMATVTKVIVLSMMPSVTVHFTHPLSGPPDTLPLLAWQFTVIQTSSANRVIDPVLSFARHQKIYFFQISMQNSRSPTITYLTRIEVSYTLQSLHWFNSRTLVTMDTLERIHVLDIKTEEELEVMDIGDVKLVYGSPYYKGLTTGKNVSRAMAAAGDRACSYSSVLCNLAASAHTTAQLLLLGTQAVYMFTLRTWLERIETLVAKLMFPEALNLALSFYEDKAKAVVGLKAQGSRTKSREMVSEKMVELLNKYTDLSLTKLCPDHGKIDQLLDHYRNVIPVIIKHCLAIKNYDLLMDSIYEKFALGDPMAKLVFIESLEPFILDNCLTSLRPEIAKDMVTLYAERRRFQALEALLVHLEVICLDIDHVMRLCWSESLYDVIIYIHNQAFCDYVTPLEQLLGRLQTAIIESRSRPLMALNETEVNLGNKILVYISSCLSGRAYPIGMIPDDKKQQVCSEILEFLTKREPSPPKYQAGQQNGSSVPEDGLFTPYPYLKTLLYFDAHEFLNVLAIAFNEGPSFIADDVVKWNETQQQMVEILLEVMVNMPGFSISQIGALFLYLARQMARSTNDAEGNFESGIQLNKSLFEQVIEHLTNPNDDTRTDERQQALLDLIGNDRISSSPDLIDYERLLRASEKAKFYRVSEFIYTKDNAYDKILSCYLRDHYRKNQVFIFIIGVLTNNEIASDHKNKLIQAVFHNIEALVQIDSQKAAQILLSCIQTLDQFAEILFSLQKQEMVQLKLLDAIINFDPTNLIGPANLAAAANLPIIPINQLPLDASQISQPRPPQPRSEQIALPTSPSHIDQRKALVVTEGVHELYIRLLCKFHPEKVLDHLIKCNTRQVITIQENGYEPFVLSYRTDLVLQICRSYEVKDAVAYLLECDGQFSEAFDLLYGDMKCSLENLKTAMKSLHGDTVAEEDAERLAAKRVKMIIEFCQRSSERILETDQREALWFPILELLMMEQQSLCEKDESDQDDMFLAYKVFLKENTTELLNGMMGHVSLLNLLQKLLAHDHHQDGHMFGESSVKSLMMAMLEAYNYEETLLQTTINLINRDLHSQLAHYVYEAKKGIDCRVKSCAACEQPFSESNQANLTVVGDDQTDPIDKTGPDSIYVFHCKHSFHQECLPKARQSRQAKQPGASLSNVTCPKCDKSTSDGKASNANKTLGRGSSSKASVKVSDRMIRGERYGLTIQQIKILDSLKERLRSCRGRDVLNQLSPKNTIGGPSTSSNRYTSTGEIDEISLGTVQEKYKLNLAPRGRFKGN